MPIRGPWIPFVARCGKLTVGLRLGYFIGWRNEARHHFFKRRNDAWLHVSLSKESETWSGVSRVSHLDGSCCLVLSPETVVMTSLRRSL